MSMKSKSNASIDNSLMTDEDIFCLNEKVSINRL